MSDVDRRKHDVDVLERVLGGVHDTVGTPETATHVIEVDVPWFGGSIHSTVELSRGVLDERSESELDRQTPRADDRRS